MNPEEDGQDWKMRGLRRGVQELGFAVAMEALEGQDNVVGLIHDSAVTALKSLKSPEERRKRELPGLRIKELPRKKKKRESLRKGRDTLELPRAT